MSQHYDDLESRAPAAREADLMARLPDQIRHAQQHSPAFASILQGVDAASISSRAALVASPLGGEGAAGDTGGAQANQRLRRL